MPRQYGNEVKQSFLGDFARDASGDIAQTAIPEEALEYISTNRIKTIDGDWIYEGISANLLQYVGEPNTRETAEKIQKSIVLALTNDKLISRASLRVKVVPIDQTTIMIFVFVNGHQFITPIRFSYTNGFDMVVA